jgi:hypothetical protein
MPGMSLPTNTFLLPSFHLTFLAVSTRSNAQPPFCKEPATNKIVVADIDVVYDRRLFSDKIFTPYGHISLDSLILNPSSWLDGSERIMYMYITIVRRWPLRNNITPSGSTDSIRYSRDCSHITLVWLTGTMEQWLIRLLIGGLPTNLNPHALSAECTVPSMCPTVRRTP